MISGDPGDPGDPGDLGDLGDLGDFPTDSIDSVMFAVFYIPIYVSATYLPFVRYPSFWSFGSEQKCAESSESGQWRCACVLTFIIIFYIKSSTRNRPARSVAGSDRTQVEPGGHGWLFITHGVQSAVYLSLVPPRLGCTRMLRLTGVTNRAR